MKRIVLSLLVVLVFMGCDYKCGEYPQFMSEYLPYSKSHTVSFENGRGDIMEFDVTNSDINQPISMSVNCDCDCQGSKRVILNNKNASDSIRAIEFWFDTFIERRDIGAGLCLRLYIFSHNRPSFSKYDCLGKFDYYRNDFDPYKDKNADKIPLVIDIPNGGGKISRVKIEHGKGLVEFDDKINNCTWKLVE